MKPSTLTHTSVSLVRSPSLLPLLGQSLLVALLPLLAFSSVQAQLPAPTWSTATVPAAVPANTGNTFNSIAYNGTKFVASGLELNVISSTDGVNWTSNGRMSAATTVSVFDLTWIPHLSKWVAPTNVNLGVNAVIYTSTDGITWSPTNSGVTVGVPNNFATDGTTLIGTVSAGGVLVKSTDASTWSTQTLGIAGIGSLFSIIHVPSTGKWVAVGGTGGIITSPDGTNWTKQTGPSGITGIIRTVAYGNGRYVVGANAVNLAGWSTDGVTWNNSTTGLASSGLTRMTFVNGVFVAVGTSGAIITSTDGATWSAAHVTGTTDNISDVVANGTGPSAKVVAVGGSSAPLIRHIDASLLNAAATAPEIAITEPGVGNVADGASFTFGSSPVGTPVAKTFTITNSGDAALNLTGSPKVTITGTDASRFVVTSAQPSSPVAANGGTTSFTITFTPSAAFAHSASVTINNDDGNENPFDISLSGTGTPPPVAVTSLNTANATPTNATTVNWTLTFPSAVTGVTASNFTLTGPAAAGLTVGLPATSNGGLTWTIPVNTGATDGLLTLNLANATGLTPAISTTLPFTGQSYTIDKTPPTVVSVTRLTPLNQTTNATTMTFRVTYSEPVTGITTARYRVVPVNGSNIVGTVNGVASVGGNPAAIYDVTVNLTSGTGEFRLRVLD